jgi:hypothetical protein
LTAFTVTSKYGILVVVDVLVDVDLTVVDAGALVATVGVVVVGAMVVGVVADTMVVGVVVRIVVVDPGRDKRPVI